MRWEIFIIPLIALGVWIIGTLFKSEDDKSKKAAGRRENVAGRAPGRRMVTDLDRFLEESRRRREPEQRAKPPSPPQGRAAPVSRPPLRERPTPSPEPPRPIKPVAAKEEVLVAQPAPQPVTLPPTVEPLVGRSRASEKAPSPPPAPASRPSPIPQQVRSMLSNPQSAAAAFMLREIFDRPLCKRRR